MRTVKDARLVKDSVNGSILPAAPITDGRSNLLTNKDLPDLQSSGQFSATPREGKVITHIPVTVKFPDKPEIDAWLLVEAEVDYTSAVAKSNSFTFPFKGQSKKSDKPPNPSNSTSIIKSLLVLLFGEDVVAEGILSSVMSPVTFLVGQEWTPTPPVKSLMSLLGLSKSLTTTRTQQGVQIVQTQVSLINFRGRKDTAPLLHNTGIIQSIVQLE